jgi:hypothetical protein
MEDTYSSKVPTESEKISSTNKSGPLTIQQLEKLTTSQDLRDYSIKLDESQPRFSRSQISRSSSMVKQRNASRQLTGSSSQSNLDHENKLKQIQEQLYGKKLTTENIESEITALRKNLLRKSQEGNYFLANLDESHERILHALRNQIASLKQQHEYNTAVQEQEISRLQEEYDSKIRQADKDRAATVNVLKERLESYHKSLFSHNEQMSEARHMSNIMQIQHDESIKSLTDKMKDLTLQAEQYKQKLSHISQVEIPKLEQEKKELIREHEKVITNFRVDHEKNILDMQNRVDLKELQIEKLEYEIADIRRKLISKTQEGDNYIQQMQEKLLTSQRNLEIYKQDLKRLTTIQEDVTNERKILKNESSLLKHEYSRIRKENRRLSKECKKLGGLVYGKLSVSPIKRSKSLKLI